MKKRLLYCETNAYDMIVSIDEEDNCRYLIETEEFPTIEFGEDEENENKILNFLQTVEDDSSWSEDCSKEEIFESEGQPNGLIVLAEIEKEL